ncbi:MAG TPA: glycosyltransferase family 39 protein, partial [Acidobacteriaceae bacterium]|nr:glycosyltransferase family 39 protein [Acidobacteriaceae bacterium]
MTLDGDVHDWASTNCMTQARSFLELGPWRTHFVPVQNNPPLGLDPDVYLHWPPLVPLVISWFMRILGDREAAGRIVELLVSFGTAAGLLCLGKVLYSVRVGLLAGFFYLTAPATYIGGRVIVQPPMSVMFAVAGVLFYALAAKGSKRRALWAAAGIASMVCMVLASWDPIFVPLGLLLAALYARDRAQIKLAAGYLAASMLTFAAIQADYILSYPAFFGDQVSTIGYRMGLPFKAPSIVRLHSIVDMVGYKTQLPAATILQDQVSNLLRLFHPFLLLAGCLFVAFWWQPAFRREGKRLLVIGGLAFPWILWAIVMRQYVGIHEFTLVLAAPFLALATGVMLEEILLKLLHRREWAAALWVMTIVLPMLVFHNALQAAIHVKEQFTKPQYRDFSALVERETPPNAIVLSPEQFSVPVYYSKRHIVRGIDSPQVLRQAAAQAHAAFPGSPLYLAVKTDLPNGLGAVLASITPVATLGDSAVYRLP